MEGIIWPKSCLKVPEWLKISQNIVNTKLFILCFQKMERDAGIWLTHVYCVLCNLGTVYYVLCSKLTSKCVLCSLQCVLCSWCILCNGCFFDILCVVCTVQCLPFQCVLCTCSVQCVVCNYKNYTLHTTHSSPSENTQKNDPALMVVLVQNSVWYCVRRTAYFVLCGVYLVQCVVCT